MKDIKCDKKGCKKIIGHVRRSGSNEYYDGTHQIGYKSFCSEKHIEDYRKSLPTNNEGK